MTLRVLPACESALNTSQNTSSVITITMEPPGNNHNVSSTSNHSYTEF